MVLIRSGETISTSLQLVDPLFYPGTLIVELVDSTGELNNVIVATPQLFTVAHSIFNASELLVDRFKAPSLPLIQRV